MKYAEEKITYKLLEELEPLLKTNALETGISDEFEINKLVYVRAAMAGAYVGVTARTSRGKCVGYGGFAITEHLYFPKYKMAQQDALYLHEDYRKGMIGIKLIKKIEEVLKKDHEVNLILQGSMPERDTSSLFLRLGYKERDRIFIKEL